MYATCGLGLPDAKTPSEAPPTGIDPGQPQEIFQPRAETAQAAPKVLHEGWRTHPGRPSRETDMSTFSILVAAAILAQPLMVAGLVARNAYVRARAR